VRVVSSARTQRAPGADLNSAVVYSGTGVTSFPSASRTLVMSNTVRMHVSASHIESAGACKSAHHAARDAQRPTLCEVSSWAEAPAEPEERQQILRIRVERSVGRQPALGLERVRVRVDALVVQDCPAPHQGRRTQRGHT
jgi:hypothetical protein